MWQNFEFDNHDYQTNIVIIAELVFRSRRSETKPTIPDMQNSEILRNRSFFMPLWHAFVVFCIVFCWKFFGSIV